MNFFEAACRVPLIFHAPALLKPATIRQSISLIDLLPTLVEIAGDGQAPVSYASELEGRSLLPHLHNSGGHDEGLGEYLAEGAIAPDRKSTRLDSSHLVISYAAFCLKKKQS